MLKISLRIQQKKYLSNWSDSDSKCKDHTTDFVGLTTKAMINGVVDLFPEREPEERGH